MEESLLPLLENILFAAIAVYSFMTVVYLIGLARKDNSIVHIAWGIAFIIIMGVGYLRRSDGYPRELLIALLVVLWGTRLAIHIAVKNQGRPEDKRYQEFRKNWRPNWLLKSYFKIYILQGTLALIISLPVLITFTYTPPGFAIINSLGFLIWIAGFITETGSDLQLLLFKSRKGSKKSILSSGFWKYSRHPNYFGECIQWWGIWLISACSPIWLLGIAGPATLTWLLTRVSGVPLTEKALKKRKGFKEYVKNTNALIPWYPRHQRPKTPGIILRFSVALIVIIIVLPIMTPLPRSMSTREAVVISSASFTSADGYSSYYQIQGSPSDPPVILLHGFGGSSYDWHKTSAFLAENGFYVIVPDLKGFGLSQKRIRLLSM